MPLEVYRNTDKTNLASVASFLLFKITEKKFVKENIDNTLKLLVKTKKIFPHGQQDISLTILRKDYQQVKLNSNQQSIIEYFINLAEEGRIDELTGDDILSV